MDQGHELWIYKVVGWLSASIATAAGSLAGWMYRRYRRDRKLLHELKRKMDEVDSIRRQTQDGQRAMIRLEHVDERLDTLAAAVETVVERQDAIECAQHDMRNDLTEIKTDVKWLCQQWSRR